MRDQDTATRAARLLQLSLVSMSPRAVQSDLRSPGVVARLSPKDYRSLSPLISHHDNPVGWFEVDLEKWIDFEPTAA